MIFTCSKLATRFEAQPLHRPSRYLELQSEALSAIAVSVFRSELAEDP